MVINIILLVHDKVLAAWRVQEKTLYRKTPRVTPNGYQQFQMASTSQAQSTAKHFSEVCGATLKTILRKRKNIHQRKGENKKNEKEQRKYQVRAGGGGGAAWWRSSPHYSSWKIHAAADGYSWKKLSPWGPHTRGGPKCEEKGEAAINYCVLAVTSLASWHCWEMEEESEMQLTLGEREGKILF